MSLSCGDSRTAPDVAIWGVTEVPTWLETLQLPEYVENFVRHDIHGRELLTSGRRDPKEFYVTKVGHMKKYCRLSATSPCESNAG
jgi:hypothetical protein